MTDPSLCDTLGKQRAEGRCDVRAEAGKIDHIERSLGLDEGHTGAPGGRKAIMIWARRLAIGAGLAFASVAVVPGVAGVAGAAPTTNCPAGTTVNPSMTPPTPNCPTVVPTVSGTAQPVATSNEPTAAATSTTPSSAGTSSLPFTGADVEELAVIGGVALLAGALLMRRRRSATV